MTSRAPSIGRLGVDAQDDLFVGGADERVVYIRQARNRRAVDREDVIAGLYVDTDLGQRRTRFLLPIFAGQDAIDAISFCRRIARKLRAEQAKLDARRLRSLAAADVGVTVVQLADQLADEISEIVAMIHERQQRGVLVAHRFPIDAVHVRRVEEVAHLPPGFEVDLLPLGVAIELHVETLPS